MTDPFLENMLRVNRRQLFGSAASGAGVAALATLMKPSLSLGADALSRSLVRSGGLPDAPHHPPKAKRVVVLWQGGGPSHVDLFDDKPKLRELAGQDIPDSVRGTIAFLITSNDAKL